MHRWSLIKEQHMSQSNILQFSALSGTLSVILLEIWMHPHKLIAQLNWFANYEFGFLQTKDIFNEFLNTFHIESNVLSLYSNVEQFSFDIKSKIAQN